MNANQRNISMLCGSDNGNETSDSLNKPQPPCKPQSCSVPFAYVPALGNVCYCAAPFGVGLRLRSPSISYFPPYLDQFYKFMTTSLYLNLSQLYVDSIAWEPGPRLRMFLLFFPAYTNQTQHYFNNSEIQAIENAFARFTLPSPDVFGPYDLLNFTPGFYSPGTPSILKCYFLLCHQ